MALHIQRNRGESIVVVTPDGQHITITVDSRTRMAIEAADDINILRSELLLDDTEGHGKINAASEGR